MASRLERLVPAGSYFLLTRQERGLLRFALDRFGEPLSQFLLSGVGEDTEVPARLFSVTFSDRAGVSYTRRIKVVARSRGDAVTPSLPRRKDPLVMLAFLRLLIDVRRMSSFAVRYEQKEVLSLLGWETNEDNRLALDEAVRRYSGLSYEWAMGEEELKAKGLDFYESEEFLISGYGYENSEGGGGAKRAWSEITFSGQFVKELLGRSLFGINWDSVFAIEG